MAPGDAARGSVRIGDTGSGPGLLWLSPRNLTQAGDGAALARALRLRVMDVTSGSDAVVYQGSLAAFSPRKLIVLGPGDARTYRFVATLPDGGVPSAPGAGDNTLQGASAKVDFRWALDGGRTRRCGAGLTGDATANRLVGGSGSDRLVGGGGGDTLIGLAGRDCIKGGPGADLIRADDGAVDVVRCGPGADSARVDARDRLRGCESVRVG
jgi:Ca2+-binding RTX toxin-like protein